MRSNRVWRWAMVAAVGVFGVAALRLAPPTADAGVRSLAPADLPVATVDLKVLLDGLDELKTREAELNGFKSELDQRVREYETRAEAARQDLTAITRGSPNFREVQTQSLRAEAQLRIEQELALALVEARTRELQLDLYERMLEGIAEFAQREGYGLVLSNDVDAEIPPGLSPAAMQNRMLSKRVLYVEEAVDITSAVQTRMNNAWRNTGGAGG